mmetsp:Transcript_32880/g.76790  ORF Transcript_32880/g.76790 Transcript_32880/m.76790 type:complete len:491 (-) Transcript_32880:72-1544(-)
MAVASACIFLVLHAVAEVLPDLPASDDECSTEGCALNALQRSGRRLQEAKDGSSWGGRCSDYGCTHHYHYWMTCQCNSACSQYGNCCPDYSEKCASHPQLGTCATYGCTSSYKPESRCQCNSQCAKFGNCCDDYVATCTASTTSASSEASAPATPATSAPSVSPGPPERSSRYRLKWSAQGESFFDNWNFLWEDHNHGSAQYLLEPEAKEESVIEATRNFAIIRAGRRSPKYKYKRMTTRMESKRSWKYFLTLIKFSHVPYGCGVWPALFTLAPNVPWPNGGELDILEYVNMDVSKASFHTGGECKLSAEKVNKYGPMPDRNNMDYDCVTDYPDRLGCAPNKWMKSGTEWAHSPGILATQWTESFLKIFYIPEHEIPQDILADNPSPDKTWDDRWLFSYYPFTGTKCIFEEQKLMMQINFCGDWAGKVWGADGNCNWRVPNCRAVDPLAEYAPDQDCCTQWIWDENDRFGTETYLKERAFFNISYIKVFQ